MEFIIQGIRFVYPGCKVLTKEQLFRSYGNADINGSDGKKRTHANLSKNNAELVWKALKQDIEDQAAKEKRAKAKEIKDKEAKAKENERLTKQFAALKPAREDNPAPKKTKSSTKKKPASK